MKMTRQAAQGIVAAMIKQAVDDYRYFERKGYIMDGKVTLPKEDELSYEAKFRKVRGVHLRRQNCEELIEFFKKGGTMDIWIDLVALPIEDPDAIRERLSIN